MMYGWEDCPQDIRNQVTLLNDRFIQYIGDNLVGTYIHGSLSLHSFNPRRSDIDMIVLLNDKLDLDTRFVLIKELLHISNNPAPIEISFITKAAIKPWQHPTPFELHSSEYWRAKYEERVAADDKSFWAETPTDSDLACHLTLIRSKGICVYGEPIADVFPEVPEADFRSSILNGIDYTARAILANPVYEILTLCRILSYLERNEIISKREAGLWALEKIPDHLKYLVISAVEVHEGSREEMVEASVTDIDQYASLMKSYISQYIGD